MGRFWAATCLLALTALLGGAGRAAAQGGRYPQFPIVDPRQPILQQPNVSPYLGLLQRNNNNSLGLGYNYFNIVQPEIRTRDQFQRQQLEQNRLAQEQLLLQRQQQLLLDPNTRPSADPRTGFSRTIRPTGHMPTIMNLGGRFGTR